MRAKRVYEQVTVPQVPVRKENETDYNKAMDRMTRMGHARETPMDIIAYLEREIDEYRAEIVRLRNRDETLRFSESTELVAEGMPIDGFFRMDRDDVLILHTKRIVREEELAGKQEKITARTGIKTAIFDGTADIVGVVRHGA